MTSWSVLYPDIFRIAYGIGNGRRAPVVTSTLLIGGSANGKHDAETQRATGQLLREHLDRPPLRAYRSEPGMLPRSDELIRARAELYLRRQLWLHPASAPVDMFVHQSLSPEHARAMLEEFHVPERG